MSQLITPMRTRHGARTVALVALLIALVAAAALPLRVAFAQEGSGTVIVTSGRLNVRGGAGATFAVVGKLPAGAVVDILERNAAGDWLRVASDELGVEGWVAAAFIEAGGAAPAAPASATLPATMPATIASPARGGLAGLAGVVISAATPTAVATGAPTVAAAVTLPTPTPGATLAATAPVAGVTPSIASPASGPAASAAQESPAAVASAPATQPEPDVATAYVVPAAMNVRGGPGTIYARTGGVKQGDALPISGVTAAGDWYRVQLPDGQEGWVSAALVTTAGPMADVATLADADIPAPPVAEVAPAALSADAASAPAVGAAVAAAPLPTGGGGFAYGLTANLWQGDKAGVAGMLNDLGANWVKQQVRWEYVETSPGAVNWQEMDDIVNQ